MIKLHICVVVPSVALRLFFSFFKIYFPIRLYAKFPLLPSTSLSYFIPYLFLSILMVVFFFIVKIPLTFFHKWWYL